jgi:hypothetical protein
MPNISVNSSDPQVVIAESRKKLTGETYAFPNDDTIDNNFTIITFYEYARGIPQQPPSQKSVASIVLPLPTNGLQDINNLQFADVNVGGTLASLSNLGKAGNILEGAAAAIGIKAARTGAGIAADLVGGNGENAKNLAEMSVGAALNPNLGVAFKGVDLRSHSFSWRLVPKNRDESTTVLKIVQAFKKLSLPTKVAGSVYALNYPKVAEISFQPPIVQFSELGLFVTDVTATFDGDGHPAFYQDTGHPVVVDLTVKFKERGIITSESYNNYLYGQ